MANHHGTQLLSILIHNRSVYTTITSSAAVASQWVQRIKTMHQDVRCRLIVGFDIELVSQPPSQRVATIQFSVDQQCLIYRMILTGALPPPLVDFLLDSSNNFFVGFGLQHKLEVLIQEAGIDKRVPYIELGNYAARMFLRPDLNGAGLIELMAVLLPSLRVERLVGLNRHSGGTALSYEDAEYACAGAYLSLEIGLVLVRPSRFVNQILWLFRLEYGGNAMM